MVFEQQFRRQRFCQHVSRLSCRFDRVDFDAPIIDGRSEVVVLDIDMLHMQTPLMLGSQSKCTAVVFEDFAMDGGLIPLVLNAVLFHFFKQIDHRYHIAKGIAESDILRLQGGEHDGGLELGCLKNKATTRKRHNKTRTRACSVWVINGGCDVPISAEVRNFC